MRIPRFFRNNRKLLLVFLVYCVLLFFFAGLYEGQYDRNPRAFAFNSDVLTAQEQTFKATTEAEANSLQTQLHALNQLKDQLKSEEVVKLTYWLDYGDVKPSPRAEFRTSDFRLVFRKGMSGYAQDFFISVDFYDKQENNIGSQAVPNYLVTQFPDHGSQYQSLIDMIAQRLQPLIYEDQRRLLALEGSNSQVWTYWDFLYFSTMTQTTVGYGDILPNNTTVRMTVTVQVLLGVLFLAVVINLSFRKTVRFSPRSGRPTIAQRFIAGIGEPFQFK